MDKKTKEPKNLVGRQVYFKMSKKVFAKQVTITPNKLYTITKVWSADTLGVDIVNDKGYTISILRNPDKCAHLDLLTGWTLKRLPKNG